MVVGQAVLATKEVVTSKGACGLVGYGDMTDEMS